MPTSEDKTIETINSILCQVREELISKCKGLYGWYLDDVITPIKIKHGIEIQKSVITEITEPELPPEVDSTSGHSTLQVTSAVEQRQIENLARVYSHLHAMLFQEFEIYLNELYQTIIENTYNNPLTEKLRL